MAVESFGDGAEMADEPLPEPGGHRRFFDRPDGNDAARFDEVGDLVVFERFQVVWTQP